MHFVLRTSFIAYGFGCWARVAIQLREYNVTTEAVHYYVHKVTRLATFDLYMGIHLDIDSLISWVSERIDKLPNKPLFYFAP